MGCSATTSPSSSSQVQIRMAQLEKDLRTRDAEIEKLQADVQQLSYQVDDIESSRSTTNNTAIRTQTSQPSSSTSKVSTGGATDGEIIRVAASAQDVQKALKNAGYYSYNIDGKLGDITKQAIKSFQKDHGLNPDGVIGKQTWAELKSYLQ